MEYKMSDRYNMYYIIYDKDGNKYDYDKRCRHINLNDGNKEILVFFDENNIPVAIFPLSTIQRIESRICR